MIMILKLRPPHLRSKAFLASHELLATIVNGVGCLFLKIDKPDESIVHNGMIHVFKLDLDSNGVQVT